MGDEQADLFRFRIDGVFAITGRGTAVAGFIEQGAVRAGDRLRLISDGTEGAVVVCRSVEFADQPGWRPGDPVTVGLIVPDLPGHDAAHIDMLVGEALQAQDGRS